MLQLTMVPFVFHGQLAKEFADSRMLSDVELTICEDSNLDVMFCGRMSRNHIKLVISPTCHNISIISNNSLHRLTQKDMQ
jgi:hypothetical protein